MHPYLLLAEGQEVNAEHWSVVAVPGVPHTIEDLSILSSINVSEANLAELLGFVLP